MHLPYRSDIDGLRAFAVTSVLIFHAFPSLIPGGFVGVDVFFVISGFLISGIIFRELEAGEFSFANFYARRVKRIFPALITMLAASYAFGWFFLFNDDFRRLGSHIFRASLFLSNFILWNEAGYFDYAAETKPLLHLWSLGIEEQFYILWPLVLWAFWRFKSARLVLVGTVTVCSFIWNVYQSQHDLTHDFYSPLTRFWELSTGACLAFATGRYQFKRSLANVFSFIGGGLLLASIFLIDRHKIFPGAWALMPVLGAAFLIHAGPLAWANKYLLSRRMVVWVGAVSYPLYLWHWPALTFARILEGTVPTVAVRLAALFVALLLAVATFVWVEKPIRFAWKSSLKTFSLVISMVVVGYFGLICKQKQGHPERPVMQKVQSVNAGDLGQDAFYSYYFEKFHLCSDTDIHLGSGQWNGKIRCFQSKAQSSIDLVILGDSHAEHLFAGLSESYPALNVAVYPRSGLSPFIRYAEFKEIYQSVLNDRNLKDVVLTSMWGRGDPLSLEDQKVFAADLDETLTALNKAGKRVTLITDSPKFYFDAQRCKFNHPVTGNSQCNQPIDSYQEVLDSYVPILQSAVNLHRDVRLIDLRHVFCTDQTCHMAINAEMLYRDDHHLNLHGSRIAAKFIAREMQFD